MPRSGQEHHNATLTDEEVARMREIYSQWKKEGVRLGYMALSRRFGVPWGTCRDIVTYRTRASALLVRTVSQGRTVSCVASSAVRGSGEARK